MPLRSRDVDASPEGEASGERTPNSLRDLVELSAEDGVDGGGGPTSYWELADPLGTGRVLLDENGARVRHTLSTPFGGEYAQVGGLGFLRKIYAGHRVHAETGLVSMQTRWYDPGAGTFLSVDPVVANAFDPQSVNAYAYARNK